MRKNTIFILLLFISNLIHAQDNIERVEPPNWWAGMEHEELQLMVYGENISNYKPSINYPGARIQQVIHTTNSNYQFINLHLEPSVQPGNIVISFLGKNKERLSYDYPLLKREDGSAQRKGFDNSDVLYLITPDRFANGDPSNDEVAGMREGINMEFPGGRHGGDIKGISDRLDYIKEMGYTAIWLNPLLENNMVKYSYHGYSTTDYYKVDPRFGSNESYKALSQKAKSMGVGMIMDMIVNHCGSFHWWMDDLPAEDWINQWPTYQQTNHKKTITQDPYSSDIDKKIFIDGWFVPTMPDLNQNNPLMANYLTQNSIWWIEYADLTGIRMDTYPYPVAEYMTEWTERVMKEYPNFNVVGEEWFDAPAVLAHWQKGKDNPNGYTSELKSLMDFPLRTAVEKALTQEETWGKGWIKLYETLGQDFLYASPDDLVIFPDNHDMDRLYTQVGENINLFKLAMIFYATTRGVPQIYYGTEILMENSDSLGNHGVIRTDFPGGWKGDSINGFTGAGLSSVQKDAQAFTKKLLNWRKSATAIHNGQLKHYVPENGVYVYFRSNEDQKVMVILNKNETATTLNLKRFAESLNDAKQAQDVFSGKFYPLDLKISLPSKAGMVLEIK